jgi:hypothetical protein
MMRVLSQRQEIMNLYPDKVAKKNGVYHALRNVFQSARKDKLEGNTYYTPRGLVKMDPHCTNTTGLIWTYAVSGNQYTAQYIEPHIEV